MMSSELTREQVVGIVESLTSDKVDGVLAYDLLTHDALLRQRVEALEQERDQWKDKHEYLDYFFNSAITERNELRVAKQSLIDTKNALQRQLQQREETIKVLHGELDKATALIAGLVPLEQVTEADVEWARNALATREKGEG